MKPLEQRTQDHLWAIRKVELEEQGRPRNAEGEYDFAKTWGTTDRRATGWKRILVRWLRWAAPYLSGV